MDITKKIGQIVAEDFRTAQVFHENNVAFCCAGAENTIEEGCKKAKVDPQVIYDGLTAFANNGKKESNYNEWPLDFLADYIAKQHHQHTLRKIPEIDAYAKKVAKVHGGHHPELVEIEQEFSSLSDELKNLIETEENILFPYIQKLVLQNLNETDNHHDDSASDLIEMLKQKHVIIESSVEKIRNLTDNYTIPRDACATYTIFFQNLQAFDGDTRKRIHLKHNILFPKTIQLEGRKN